MKFSKVTEKLISILNKRADLIVLDKKSQMSSTIYKKGQSKFDFRELVEYLESEVDGFELNWNCILCFAIGEQIYETLSIYGEGDFVVAYNDSTEFIIRIVGKEFLNDIKGLKLKESNCPRNNLLSNICKN